MPTFFFVSGFLASTSLNKPLRNVWDKRVGLLYFVYVLWTFVSVLALWLLFRDFSAESIMAFFIRFGGELLFPNTQIWFLYGLVAFFLLARIFKDWPIPTIVVAFAASAFSEGFDGIVVPQMIRSLPYFLVGIYFPMLFKGAVARPGWLTVAGLVIVYAVAMIPLLLFDRSIPGIWLIPTMIGIALILNLARVLQDWPGMEAVKYVGRNTLPIYVMHSIILIFTNALYGPAISIWFQSIGGSQIAFIYPLFGNAFLICSCLLISVALKRFGAGWLFTLPEALKLGVFASNRRGQLIGINKR
jgi:uncharacterized membrane protein YcfT